MAPVDRSKFEISLGAAWRARETKVRQGHWEAFRLIHGGGDGLTGLTIDLYAGHALIIATDPLWFLDRPRVEKSLRAWAEQHKIPVKNIYWQQNYPKPSSDPNPPPPQILSVTEGDFHFEVQLGAGLHTGLFLDQRDNRRIIQQSAKGKRVLNLFSYTGAFSVAALSGGAKEVHSVDQSGPYLQWLQRNLTLNQMENAASILHQNDVFDFFASQSKENFDLIILDPPTAFRSKLGHFSLERGLADLIQRSARLLNPSGNLFLSINTQKISLQDFQAQIKLAVKPLGFKLIRMLPLPFDFPMAPEEKSNPHLKACWIGA